jgi:rubrerythrin
MNVFHIFDEISSVDPDVYGRFDTRRQVMQQFARVGRKLTAASLPVAFGAMFQKAYGQVPSHVLDVLQFALTQELLEIEIYTTGYRSVTFPDADSKQAIEIIIDHENKHAKFLQDTIRSLGAAPIAKPKFDVTGGAGSMNGPFKDAYRDFLFYLGVVQVFEDTGVRAYKGQAPRLLGTGDILTGALRIHSMEARHAAKLREMRKKYANAPVKPWITFNEPGLGDKNALVAKNYMGEENTRQAGIEITNINNMPIEPNDASESFDEPLTKEQVLDIIRPFLVM